MIQPKFPLITATQNPVFKDLVDSLDGRGERVLVHGLKSARDIVLKNEAEPRANRKLKVKTLIARESFRIENSDAASALFQMRFADPVTRLVFSDALFDQIDPFGVPDVIVAFDRPEIPTWSFETESGESHTASPTATLIVATQNPLNLGACLRSAAAFGVKRIVGLKESASVFHVKTIRASMGHVFDLDILRGPSIHEFSKIKLSDELSNKIPERLVALDMSGTSLVDFTWPENPIFLLGEEGQGLPENFRGLKVKIPMESSVESLNVSVSASIAMYDWSMKSRPS